MTEPWDDPQAQYQAGYDAAITTARPADCWVAVPVRWRHVLVGDDIPGTGRETWKVTQALNVDGGMTVQVINGPRIYVPEHKLDLDAKVSVLEKVTMHEAVTYTVEELGGIVIERRSA